MTLVPSTVDDTMIFGEVFGEHADSREVRPVETGAAHLTIDIMGHIVLGIDLNSQHEQLPGKGVDNRYATNATRDTIKSRRKPAIDLALDEYSRQQDEDDVIKNTKGIDKAFKSLAVDQMKSFLFAGHDTSSGTVSYAYHLLNLHPDKLAKARAELDQVFGKNTDGVQTGNLIKQNPNLLNSIPYILSVIKETLRLYTPALTVRQGQGTIVYEGVTYDTEGFQVLVSSLGMHRNTDYFPSLDEFIPERFMPAPDNFEEIPKDVYRPFEKVPRDCIGQQVAILEMKIILAMTLRDFFYIKADYEIWDKRIGREKPGDILDGRRGMFGDRAYQQLIASAKPHDGLPGRVTRTKRD